LFYVATVAAAGVAALVVAGWGVRWDADTAFVNGLVAILAVALGAELSSVSVQVGTASVSVAFIPLLAAVFLFPSFWAMSVGGLTLFATDLVVRRKPWIKVIFNSAKEILSIGLASSVYEALGGRPSPVSYEFNALAVFGAGVAYTAAESIAVSLAISLSEGLRVRDVWGRINSGAALYDLLAIPLPALLAYLYVKWQLAGVAILAIPMFVLRHVYSQNIKLERAHRELLELMVKQIEARDPYTSGHSQRVAAYARTLAREAGLSARQVENIATAALLHDVGKVYEEFGPLLKKEGKLTPEERKMLQTHPVRSAELVGMISSLHGSVTLAVRHHHENYDGSGYPDGLAGEGIPIGARIIMVADTLDAMTTDRPYRKALAFEKVVEQLENHSSTQFDPRLATIAIKSTILRRAVLATPPLPGERAPTDGPNRSSGRAARQVATV
jgi:hypothetical protein